MDFLYQILVVFVTALVAENALFARSLGAGEILNYRRPKQILLFSAVLIVVTTLSSVLTVFINLALAEVQNAYLFRPILFIICITIIYVAAYLILHFFFPKLLSFVGGILPYATYNCLSIGTLLLISSKRLSLIESWSFGIGTGMGFMAALLLVYVGRRKLTLSNIPKSFKGLPITLIYIGLLSLAIYGLVGHQLPS